MCYLCLKDNPFDIKSSSKLNLDKKKERAKLIKELLDMANNMNVCSSGTEEVNKLKEEQYLLSRDL